jgi:heat shock protein HslJ
MCLYVSMYARMICVWEIMNKEQHIYSLLRKSIKFQVKSRFSAEILNQEASDVACLYSLSFRICTYEY